MPPSRIKNPAASSGVFEAARALRARDRRTECDGYQLHAASGGELTQMRLNPQAASRPI
jgi:hypothetical protein